MAAPRARRDGAAASRRGPPVRAFVAAWPRGHVDGTPALPRLAPPRRRGTASGHALRTEAAETGLRSQISYQRRGAGWRRLPLAAVSHGRWARRCCAVGSTAHGSLEAASCARAGPALRARCDRCRGCDRRLQRVRAGLRVAFRADACRAVATFCCTGFPLAELLPGRVMACDATARHGRSSREVRAGALCGGWMGSIPPARPGLFARARPAARSCCWEAGTSFRGAADEHIALCCLIAVM